MKNTVIWIQDEYIAKVQSYNPKGYNYSALVTKAGKKARQALENLGFSNHNARVLVAEAHEVANHQRQVGLA